MPQNADPFRMKNSFDEDGVLRIEIPLTHYSHLQDQQQQQFKEPQHKYQKQSQSSSKQRASKIEQEPQNKQPQNDLFNAQNTLNNAILVNNFRDSLVNILNENNKKIKNYITSSIDKKYFAFCRHLIKNQKANDDFTLLKLKSLVKNIIREIIENLLKNVTTNSDMKLKDIINKKLEVQNTEKLLKQTATKISKSNKNNNQRQTIQNKANYYNDHNTRKQLNIQRKNSTSISIFFFHFFLFVFFIYLFYFSYHFVLNFI